MCRSLERWAVITLVLFATLAFPPQQSSVPSEVNTPVQPERVLAWQLEGLTQEEIREEVGNHGVTESPEAPLLNALSTAGADAETIEAVRHAKAPHTIWKLGLRLPRPTDYLYEAAGAIFWRDWESTLPTMEEEVEKQPRDRDARLISAHFQPMAEDGFAAFGEATQAVALAPQSPYAHALRSTICYRSQLPECALRDANLFVKLRPKDAAASIVLGHTKGLQGHDEEALQAYAEAKRLHPSYSAIQAGMSRVYSRQGEFENAIASFEEVIRMDGQTAEYQFHLGQVYLVEGYARKAIEAFKRANALEPDRPEILLALGNAYLVGEHYSEAVREYQELLEKAPDQELTRAQLAKAWREEGRRQEVNQVSPDSAERSGLPTPR